MTWPQALRRDVSAARPAVARGAALGRIFFAFFVIGATSFGGGVIAHLRTRLVARHRWVDDDTFVEVLSISQTLPGLKATNVAVLVGDRLQGAAGAIAAVLGICLPGAMLMYFAGLAYRLNGERPLVAAALEGVAAAAFGLILATTIQLGRKSFTRMPELFLILLTVAGVNRLHRSEPVVLFVVGTLATLWFRPGRHREPRS